MKRSASPGTKQIGKRPFAQSVSYGRWLASDCVTKTPRLDTGISRYVDGSTESCYFEKTSTSRANPQSFEFGFESLKRCVRGTKRSKDSATGQCSVHFREVKRLNEFYLGPDLAYLKSFMASKGQPSTATVYKPDQQSPMPDVEMKADKENRAVSVSSLAPPRAPTSMSLLTKRVLRLLPLPTTTTLQSSCRDQPGSRVGEPAFDNNLFVRPRPPRQLSASKITANKTSSQTNAKQLRWGSSKGFTKQDQSRQMSLTELAQDGEFVFNPKFADVLRKLPEFRHQVIPANAIPVSSMPLSNQRSARAFPRHEVDGIGVSATSDHVQALSGISQETFQLDF